MHNLRAHHLTALHGDQCQRRAFQRVGDEDLGGVAGLIVFGIRHQLNPLVGAARPGCAARAQYPEGVLRHSAVAADAQPVGAGVWRGEGHPRLSIAVHHKIGAADGRVHRLIDGPAIVIPLARVHPLYPLKCSGQGLVAPGAAQPVGGLDVETQLTLGHTGPGIGSHAHIEAGRVQRKAAARRDREAAFVVKRHFQRQVLHLVGLVAQQFKQPGAVKRQVQGAVRRSDVTAIGQPGAQFIFPAAVAQPVAPAARAHGVAAGDGEVIFLGIQRPVHPRTTCRGAKVVFGSHHRIGSVAGAQLGIQPGDGQVHFRLAVIGNLEVQAVAGVGFHIVVTGRGVFGQCEFTGRGAELRQGQHLPVVFGLAVQGIVIFAAHGHLHGLHIGGLIAPVDRFARHHPEVHRLSGAVDWPVGVQVSQRINWRQIDRQAKVPGLHAISHVSGRQAKIGLIRRAQGHKQPLVGFIHLRQGDAGPPFGIGDAGAQAGAINAVHRHVSPGNRGLAGQVHRPDKDSIRTAFDQ